MKSTEHSKMTTKDASSLLPDAGGKSGGIENKSEDWTRFGKRQILSVGKKKESLRYNDEDDELATGDGYHSSSDEEDGRTSAVKEKKKMVISKSTTTRAGIANATEAIDDNVTTPLNGTTAQSTEKTKKSKKKKKTDSAPAVNTSVTEMGAIGSTVSAQSNVAKLDAGVDDDIKEGSTTAVNELNETVNKKKRKKIRSRQKNIRKDHRAENEKPSHLIVGTNEYCGRPITKETRQKLGIQSTAKKSAKSRATNDAFDSGEWVGGSRPDDIIDGITEKAIPETEGRRGTSTLTKIGDCLVNDGAKIDVGHNVSSSLNDTTTIKSTKKQKRKFKNLLVG